MEHTLDTINQLFAIMKANKVQHIKWGDLEIQFTPTAFMETQQQSDRISYTRRPDNPFENPSLYPDGEVPSFEDVDE